jgi:hypothetical protein
MKTPTIRSCDAFRRVTVITTVLAVAACGSGSDGTSSEAVTKSEGVQSFAGTVSCDSVGGTPQSRSWQTRVILDRPVHRGMGAEVSGAAAVQVGGLAGSVVTDARSRIAATIPASSLFAGVAAPVIDFKITASPASGSYEETGRWTIGVDENGKATLRGDSTAVLVPVANGWQASCRWDLAAAKAPSGPIPYARVDAELMPPAAAAPVAQSTPTALKAFSNCGGGLFSVVTDGLYVGAAITGYYEGYKVATLVLSVGAVGTTAGGQLAGALCPTAPLDSTNTQLAVQAAQIQQIDNYLGLATNVLYNDWYQQKLSDAQSSAYLWNLNLNGIAPQGTSKGLFGNFMIGLGLWDLRMQPSTAAPADPMALALNNAAFTNAKQMAVSAGPQFQRNLQQFSGTDFVFSSGGSCTQNDCSTHMVQVPNSALVSLYKDLFVTLQADIDTYAQPGQTPGIPAPTNRNIVPLYDQYNTMLIKFWSQSVYALDEALQMEWLVNQMNYFRYTSTPRPTDLGSIPSWGGIPGTYYTYGGKSLQEETDRYNAAQRNLARAYNARLNQLYLNTLNYLLTDVPVGPQAYPTAPLTWTDSQGVPRSEPGPAYAAEMGVNIPVPTGLSQGRTPLSLVPTPSGDAWRSQAVLYQFAGLRDVAACWSSLQAYNQTAGTAGTLQDWWNSNPNACPSIFRLADGSPLSYTCDPNNTSQCKGSVYDGNTLTPYTTMQKSTGATGGPLALATTVTGNLKYCDPGNPALYLDKRGPMLNCGQWYVPKYLANGFPRANPPGANADSNYYAVINNYTIQAGLTMNGDCSNNLSFKNGAYPAITTLTGDWSSGQPASCEAVTPTVPLVNTSSLQSPTKIGMRTITGNYDTGNQTAGCSLGWIGSGLGNPLPNYDSLYGNGDEFQFALRLPRATIGGNASGGWALPLRVTAGCTNSSKQPYLLAHPRDVAPGNFSDQNGNYSPVSNFSADGYSCTQASSAFTQPYFSCTLTDGTQYRFTLTNGNGNGTILDVRITSQ